MFHEEPHVCWTFCPLSHKKLSGKHANDGIVLQSGLRRRHSSTDTYIDRTDNITNGKFIFYLSVKLGHIGVPDPANK